MEGSIAKSAVEVAKVILLRSITFLRRRPTTACTRPRIALMSSVSLNACLVVCAAGDAGR